VKDVIVRAVQNDEELRQANELMAGTQSDNYARAHAWLTSFGKEYPGYLREHTRIAVYCGQVVAALRLTTDTIRIGEARLKMGGLGWVATDQAWRRKGIISRVMADTLHYMDEQRYHVAMLFGVSEFYGRWGFAGAVPEYCASVNLQETDFLPPKTLFKLRAAKPGDIPTMQKLHLLDEAEIACSLIRTQAHLANKWRQWEGVRVLTDARGKVAAYFRGRISEAGYIVDEAAAVNGETGVAVLHAVSRVARQAGASQLVFHVPPDHSVMRYVRAQLPEGAFERSRQNIGMLAFVNLGEALESMIPEWENRLVQAGPVPPHAEVTLVVGRAGWRVRAHHGAMDVGQGTGGNKVAFSAQELVQLTAGVLDLEEVLSAKRRIVNAEAVVLLRAMFPTRTPYVWTLDRF